MSKKKDLSSIIDENLSYTKMYMISNYLSFSSLWRRRILYNEFVVLPFGIRLIRTCCERKVKYGNQKIWDRNGKNGGDLFGLLLKFVLLMSLHSATWYNKWIIGQFVFPLKKLNI